jgi:hypothetical protein
MGDPSHNENRGETEQPVGEPGAVEGSILDVLPLDEKIPSFQPIRRQSQSGIFWLRSFLPRQVQPRQIR